MNSVRQRVARGVAVLDKNTPRWARRVHRKAGNIDMGSLSNNFLVWLYRDKYPHSDPGVTLQAAIMELLGCDANSGESLTPRIPFEHGFAARHGDYGDLGALNTEWRRVIRELA